MSQPEAVTTRPLHRVRFPDATAGVRLELAPRRHAGERPIVCGAFRVARKDANEPPAPRHKSIVLVIDFPTAVDKHRRAIAPPFPFTPFESKVLLADDEVDSAGHVEGSFGVDVWELFGDDFPRAPFTIFAVLGLHASNLLDVPL
jgi:hypothetical protein